MWKILCLPDQNLITATNIVVVTYFYEKEDVFRLVGFLLTKVSTSNLDLLFIFILFFGGWKKMSANIFVIYMVVIISWMKYFIKISLVKTFWVKTISPDVASGSTHLKPKKHVIVESKSFTGY